MMKLTFKYFIIASFTKHFLEIPYDSIIEVLSFDTIQESSAVTFKNIYTLLTSTSGLGNNFLCVLKETASVV